MKYSLAPAILALALCACQADDGGNKPLQSVTDSLQTTAKKKSPTPTRSPVTSPTPTPTPTSTPSPTPVPEPGVLDDGVTIVVAEGDSITSPKSPLYYSGAFASAHSEIVFHNRAVAGSTLKQLVERRDADLALNPDLLTVFIGANGFGPDASSYAAQVFDYVAPFRAMGTKVYIVTVLPRNIENDPMDPAFRNAERRKYAQIMQDAVGKQIDGIVDFGRAPIIGDDGAPLNRQLYSDGLHPTTRDYNGGIGGHDYLYDIYENVIGSALKSLQR